MEIGFKKKLVTEPLEVKINVWRFLYSSSLKNTYYTK